MTSTSTTTTTTHLVCTGIFTFSFRLFTVSLVLSEAEAPDSSLGLLVRFLSFLGLGVLAQ